MAETKRCAMDWHPLEDRTLSRAEEYGYINDLHLAYALMGHDVDRRKTSRSFQGGSR